MEWCQLGFRILALLQEGIAQPGPVMHQTSQDISDQRRDIARCGPAPPAVVEHNWYHGREMARRQQLPGLDQRLIQQANVDHETHGHVAINGGLEFQEQVDI